MHEFLDYNTCVDKIIQISPCYDLSAKVEKKKVPEFGYTENKEYSNYKPMGLGEQDFLKEEADNIDLMGEEFQFDGGDIWYGIIAFFNEFIHQNKYRSSLSRKQEYNYLKSYNF